MGVIAGFVRHGSNTLLLVSLAAFAAAFASRAIALVPVAIVIGAALFALSEYGTHRFLLHAPPASNAWLARMQRRLHYDHHREPERLDLLFLPPWFLLPVIGLFALAYAAIARDVAISPACCAATFWEYSSTSGSTTSHTCRCDR